MGIMIIFGLFFQAKLNVIRTEISLYDDIIFQFPDKQFRIGLKIPDNIFFQAVPVKKDFLYHQTARKTHMYRLSSCSFMET